MTLAEVSPAEFAEIELVTGKCPDCFGTGAVLDEDGSLTGVIGHPVACGCMGFIGCHLLTHAADCGCYLSDVEVASLSPSIHDDRSALVRGPSYWWGE